MQAAIRQEALWEDGGPEGPPYFAGWSLRTPLSFTV
jgi:hypothetical protein